MSNATQNGRVTAADVGLRDCEAHLQFEVCWFDFLWNKKTLDSEQSTFSISSENTASALTTK